MISVDRELKVNPDATGAQLDRKAVWDGLVRKAEYAPPFVAAITECSIVEYSENGFVREILLNGEKMRERITLHPMEKVVFDRLPGASAMGRITNLIEEKGGDLILRFTFDLELIGGDADAENQFAKVMEESYLAAVETTLTRIRAEQIENSTA